MGGNRVPLWRREPRGERPLSRALRRVETTAKSIWSRPVTGWLLVSGLIAAWIAFWIWPQPAGYAVTILGGVAAIMTFREMRHTQKVMLTIGIFGLMGIELRDIRKDRIKSDSDQAAALRENRDGFGSIANGLKNAINESQQQFEATMKRSDAIISKAAEAASFASGGDSFPLVFPAMVTQANGIEQIGFYLNKQGGYPLYGLSVYVWRPYRNLEANQTHGRGTTFKLEEYDTSTAYPISFQPLPNEAVAYYSASMSARNGQWEEVVEVRRVKSKIVLRWVLFGSAPGITPSKQLMDLADSGFPASVRHTQIYPLNIAALPTDPNDATYGRIDAESSK
jgi:hypothetical protein